MANMNRINKHIVLLSVLASAAFPACTPTVAQRGNILPDHKIEKVMAGTHMRSDVLRALGSPTTQSTFDPNIWYYIGQETEKRGILDPDIVKERIVMVQFHPETGVVETIKDIEAERMNIPITREKTATHGNEMGAMEQLIGNLGKYNPKEE